LATESRLGGGSAAETGRGVCKSCLREQGPATSRDELIERYFGVDVL
jgi:hypothetical protein